LDKIELDIDPDVEKVGRISMIPTLLAVICQSTGMGFAAVARVLENKWIACAVRDEVSFGLKAGDELKIETTICNEIRKEQKAIIIDHVDEDSKYCNHPTPKMYGFQSYISFPIARKNGDFFGTLCALDARPARLKIPHVMGMFELFADLISFHLDDSGPVKSHV
jgi:GAF domain-containing protein